MRRFADSLYARLALVLLLALGASYATMYALFLSNLEESRVTHFARFIADEVRLVEELARNRPGTDFSGFRNLVVAPDAPPADTVVQREGGELARLHALRQHLAEELGRPVSVVPVARPVAGLWVSLGPGAGTARWMFVATRRPHSTEPLLTATLVGFAVFFAGGLLLLWQVQRPLKRLGAALATVGYAPKLTKLPVGGAGETRVLGERFNEMVDRLHRYEEDRATMLAGVAHDLRAPITRLRLLLELDEGPRRGEMVRDLDDIERITEQFLVYARGGEDEVAEERDLAAFVDEVAAPYAGQGVNRTGAGAGILAIRANSLRRAVINLIENALEYGRAPVVVCAAVAGGEVSIRVEDAGSGIEEARIPEALRPFSRLDPSRGGKGHCGLGLVIAAHVAEKHGGALHLHNGERGGFVAEIRFPAAAA